MPQAAPTPVEEEVVEPEPPPPPPPDKPDEAIVPGKGDARRDLGIDTGTTVTPTPPTDGDAEVTDQETASGGPTITCSVCGTVNDADRTYCRKCANELKPPPPPPPPPPQPVEVRKISPMALGLGAAAVVVAIALMVVLVLGGGSPGASLGPTGNPSSGPTAIATALPTVEPTVQPTQRTFNFSEGKLTGTIAFSRCPSDGSDCVIYIRKADGSAKASRVIGATTGSAFAPAISNSGKKIVYSVEPGLRVVTISSRSYVQHSTGSGDTDAVWSPDDTQIAFAGHRDRDTGSGKTDLELRLDGATKGSSVALTSNDIPDVEPWFTPDGKSIVWVQGEGSNAELKMIDIASKAVTDLTNDSFEDHEPSVSPDGTLIAFVSNRGSSGGFDLYLLDLASPNHDIIPIATGQTNIGHPAWSPGGRYIVFSAGTAGSEGLYIIDLNTGTTTNFTSASGADLSPTWK